MFKYVTVLICALIACVAGKPGLLHTPLAVPAPIIAAPAPIVTATSSQVVARNFNGIAAAPLIAPVPVAPVVRAVAPVAAPLPAATFAHPLAAPVIARYAAATLAAPNAAHHLAAPVISAAPFAYNVPLNYAAPAFI